MKVLIVDRFPVCREALSGIIGDRFGPCDFTYTEDLPAADTERSDGDPDVTLIDGDLSAAARGDIEPYVTRSSPRPVIIMAPQLDPMEVRWARGAGVRGVIPKTYSRQLVDAAIHLVIAGGSYFPNELRAPSAQAPAPAVRGLTGRQRQVLELIAAGLSNDSIARELGVSIGTVKLHAHQAFRMIGARNRTQAALWAQRNL